jgi:hypothetical protein
MVKLDYNTVEKHFQESEILKQDPGYHFYKDISALRISLFIFLKNLISYRISIDKYYSIENIFYQEGLKRWYLQKIMLTNLHNTLASVIAYSAHVKKNKRKLHIQDKLSSLWENNVDKTKYLFIELIRDYSIHIGLIQLNQNVTILQNSTKVFNIRELINAGQFIEYFNSLNPGMQTKYNPIKDYLHTLPDKIDILEILASLRSNFINFHKEVIRVATKNQQENIISFIELLEEHRSNASKNNIRTDLVLSDSQFRHLKSILKTSL